jgi:sortase (surface protein transpeptidase)
MASGPQPLPAAADVRPVRLRIPAIGVDAPALVPLGLGADHELEAPAKFGDVGWYAAGPVPGDAGPAVIAAHVDSRSGPAPFFRLRDLRDGDQVFVARSDGQETRFVVDTVQRYPKNAFPTDAVYGPAPGSALRLITCGGSFDAAKRSYRDNIVVYASTRWG